MAEEHMKAETSLRDASGNKRRLLFFVFLLLYVVLVHSIDTLSILGVKKPFNWAFFRWIVFEDAPIRVSSERGTILYPLLGMDIFKFVGWFVIPFIIVSPTMDWGYFGIWRLKKADFYVLFCFAFLGVMAVATISFVPGLRSYYPALGSATVVDKWRVAYHTFFYTLSWIVGWEFLHRYVLLRHATDVFPKWGWLTVPLVEGVYHLTKHPLEMLGMVFLSIILCWWTLKRRNMLPAFTVHFLIEMELLLFMLVL